jgi:hypothetical protein
VLITRPLVAFGLYVGCGRPPAIWAD